LRFLGDDRLVIGAPGQAAIWRFTQAAPVLATVLGGSTGTVQAAFTPDGTAVVTSAIADQRLLEWRASDGRPLGRLLDDRAAPRGPVEISPDGKTAVADRPDGSIGLFDLASRELLATLDPSASAGGVTVWDPTGRRLASSTSDGWLTLWDVTDRRHPRATTRLKRGRSGNICSCPLIPVVFSPDGRLLVSLEVAGITIFNVAAGQVDRVLPLAPTVVDQAAIAGTFNPDGRSLAIAFGPSPTRRSTLMVLDVATGRVRASAELPYIPEGVAYVGGGSRIASVQGPPVAAQAPSSGAFTALDLWNATTLQHIGDTTTASDFLPFGAQPSPDGTRLASGSTTGAALLWDLDSNRWEATACSIAGRNLTKTEWAQYLPGRTDRALCPQFGAPG
jgi:WD40 repeat protein